MHFKLEKASQKVEPLTKKLGKDLLFVIDEFQKVAEIGDGGWLEATLRTHMQQLRNTSFWHGSKKAPKWGNKRRKGS